MADIETVQITEHYCAERTRDTYNVTTHILYKEFEDDLGRRHIEVSSSRVFDNRIVWDPARVNWSALGTVPRTMAAEFAVALTWAAEEANRIDAEIAKSLEESLVAST